MISLIQKYESNDIWLELVNYDFSNKHHRNFTDLFSFVKDKVSSLTPSLGIRAFYEWKKAHRFYSFFKNLNVLVPNESKQWLTTQNDKLWQIIADQSIYTLFFRLKKTLKNKELNIFFKNIFGGYRKNFAAKEKIVEKLDEIKTIFEKNIVKSKGFYFIPQEKKYILTNFGPQTLLKARKLALKNNLNGYYFILNYNNIYKLLTYISYREIREEIYCQFNNSMITCPYQIENQKLLNKALILKKNLSTFYGHKHYSGLVTSNYMITLNQTQKFLNDTEYQLNAIMQKSLGLMSELLHSDGYSDNIQPWDLSYYQRLLRLKHTVQTKFEDNFLFEKTFPKILKYMESLFNVAIKYINNVNNNAVYEIKDNINNRLSYWIISPYSRKNEKTAYQIDIVDKANIGKETIPLIQFIYLNLNKNNKMNFMSVKNTVHEIGHAFHSFFSEHDNAKEICGWDLIELPSQFLENLAYRYDFLSNITSSPYLSKKLFKQEIKNYTFNDIFYLNEKIIDFKTSFQLNKDVNPYSNKKIIKSLIKDRHSVGNYYNPLHETEHFFNTYENDYFSNYVYFFSENIAKKLHLIYHENDFRTIFNHFGLDKKSFKGFIQSHFNVRDIDLIKMFDYTLFNKSPL